MVGISLLVVFLGWMAARRLRERGVSAPVRQVLVVAGCAAAVGVAFALLPGSPDPGGFPAGLLWEFRLSAFGTQAVFWAALGAIFGLIGERRARETGRSAA